MNKVGNCIRILQLLSTGRMVKISELAAELDIAPEKVARARLTLNDISDVTGCTIEFVTGKDGGYYLDDDAMVPAAQLTPAEKDALVQAYEYLMAKPDFDRKDEAWNAFAKIMSNLDLVQYDPDLYDDEGRKKRPVELVAAEKVQLKRNAEIRKYHDILRRAIKSKRSVEMTYDFLKGPRRTVLADPYTLFLYDNEWQCFGFSHEQGLEDPIYHWKLCRIVDMKPTNKPFEVYSGYKLEKYLKNGIFIQHGEMFELTLIASGIRAKLFKEKEFGIHQRCVDLEDGKVKVTMEMQKNPSTYNFLLGCGDLIEIVEPEWLVEKVRDLAKSIAAKYERKP